MTVDTSAYTVGNNQPLHHARILWNQGSGTAFAGVGDGTVVTNDYTNQRWSFDATAADRSVTITFNVHQNLDTVIIAAHTLGSSGATVYALTSPDVSSAFTQRGAKISPVDDSPIAIMFNSGGSLINTRRLRIYIDAGASAPSSIGIIRAGGALQMPRPLGQGAEPLGLRPVTDIRHMDSETGQWLGRVVQRRRKEATIGWSHLDAAWYRANFAPFAATLPQNPFGLIQNAISMPESVGWCWTNDDPKPVYSEGKRINFSMSLVGFDG